MSMSGKRTGGYQEPTLAVAARTFKATKRYEITKMCVEEYQTQFLKKNIIRTQKGKIYLTKLEDGFWYYTMVRKDNNPAHHIKVDLPDSRGANWQLDNWIFQKILARNDHDGKQDIKASKDKIFTFIWIPKKTDMELLQSQNLLSDSMAEDLDMATLNNDNYTWFNITENYPCLPEAVKSTKLSNAASNVKREDLYSLKKMSSDNEELTRDCSVAENNEGKWIDGFMTVVKGNIYFRLFGGCVYYTMVTTDGTLAEEVAVSLPKKKLSKKFFVNHILKAAIKNGHHAMQVGDKFTHAGEKFIFKLDNGKVTHVRIEPNVSQSHQPEDKEEVSTEISDVGVLHANSETFLFAPFDPSNLPLIEENFGLNESFEPFNNFNHLFQPAQQPADENKMEIDNNDNRDIVDGNFTYTYTVSASHRCFWATPVDDVVETSDDENRMDIDGASNNINSQKPRSY